MATVPYSKAWKVVARGLRGVVQASGVSRELFDLKLAVPEFRKMLASVDRSIGPGPVVCSHCQEAVTTDLKVVTCDIDQAFESCRNSTITPAWGVIQPFYQAKYQDNNVLVARSRKNNVKHGQKGFSRDWWGLTQGALLRSLLVTAMMTMVALGNIVLVLDGLSIGGMVSAAAVAIRLAAEEAQGASLRGEHSDQK